MDSGSNTRGVQVSKNTNHFHIALMMPPMQMDINFGK